jgi:hypothetical protein
MCRPIVPGGAHIARHILRTGLAVAEVDADPCPLERRDERLGARQLGGNGDGLEPPVGRSEHALGERHARLNDVLDIVSAG